MANDLTFALRMLRRNRGYAIAAMATLALGTGATTAIFSLVDAVLLRPLDLPSAERVVALQQATPYGPVLAFRYDEFLARQAAAAGAANLTIEYTDPVTIETPGGLVKRPAAFVGADYFDVLQRPPVRGRGFNAEDDRPGAEPVAIVGYAYWWSAFAGDERLIGSVLRIGGEPFTVVGIAAPRTRGTELRSAVDVFMPAHAVLRTTTIGRGAGNYFFQDGSPGWSPSASWRIVGRLRPGVARESLAARFGTDRIEPVPIQRAAISARVRGDVSRFSTVLFVAVVLVLAIGCANVAGLALARTEARRRDIAIRLAMGIPRARLVRQLMVECLVLAGCGSALGFVLGRWILIGLSSFELPGFISLAAVEYDFDIRLLAFSVGLSGAVAIAFGLAPARMAARVEILSGLKRGAGQGGGARLRHVLIFGQVATTVVLLFAAGLFVRSLKAALGVDVGSDTAHVVVADADLRAAKYDPARQAEYFELAAARLSALPGVSAVSWGTGPFIFAGNSTPVVVVDGQSTRLPKNVATFQGGPGYFKTLGIRLSRGRDFTWADGPGAPPVAVVNAAFARRFWGDTDPIGRRIRVQPWIGDAVVVGVAEDGKYMSLTEEGRLAVFAPWRQTAGSAFSAAVMVRTEGSAQGAVGPVRTELTAVDRAVFVSRVNTLSGRVEQLMTPQRFGSWLLTSFAAVGLLLGMIGVHGLLSYLIAQRTHEIGVRMALGARRRDVARVVAGGVLTAVGGGAVAGVAASLWLARLIEPFLFGVAGRDPQALGAALGLLVLAAIAGGLIPVRRATRVDPMVALRTD